VFSCIALTIKKIISFFNNKRHLHLRAYVRVHMQRLWKKNIMACDLLSGKSWSSNNTKWFVSSTSASHGAYAGKFGATVSRFSAASLFLYQLARPPEALNNTTTWTYVHLTSLTAIPCSHVKNLYQLLLSLICCKKMLSWISETGKNSW
jgi:hypothetical protein